MPLADRLPLAFAFLSTVRPSPLPSFRPSAPLAKKKKVITYCAQSMRAPFSTRSGSAPVLYAARLAGAKPAVALPIVLSLP